MAASAPPKEEEQEEGEVANPCAECAGGCCSFRNINISYVSLEKGERYDSRLLEYLEDGTLEEQLLMEDGSLPEMEWYLLEYDWHEDGESGRSRSIVFDCGHLTEGGLCGSYENRPGMCRTFECEALQGEEDLEEFLDRHRIPDEGWEDHPHAELTPITERVEEILGRAQ